MFILFFFFPNSICSAWRVFSQIFCPIFGDRCVFFFFFLFIYWWSDFLGSVTLMPRTCECFHLLLLYILSVFCCCLYWFNGFVFGDHRHQCSSAWCWCFIFFSILSSFFLCCCCWSWACFFSFLALMLFIFNWVLLLLFFFSLNNFTRRRRMNDFWFVFCQLGNKLWYDRKKLKRSHGPYGNRWRWSASGRNKNTTTK